MTRDDDGRLGVEAPMLNKWLSADARTHAALTVGMAIAVIASKALPIMAAPFGKKLKFTPASLDHPVGFGTSS